MPDSRGSRWRPRAALALPALLAACLASADDHAPALGQPLDSNEREALDQHVFPDGQGLPPGHGDAERGRTIYAARCAGCHGDRGQGGSAMELVGDRTLLATEIPDRGIGVIWPYAPTLFEYIRRSMPPAEPYSLDSDEIYSLIALLLELNGLLEPGRRVDAALLANLRMPNRDNFRSGHGQSE